MYTALYITPKIPVSASSAKNNIIMVVTSFSLRSIPIQNEWLMMTS
jgi:hypothetical protein